MGRAQIVDVEPYELTADGQLRVFGGDAVPTPLCRCGMPISVADLGRGHHSCGRTVHVEVGEPHFGVGR